MKIIFFGSDDFAATHLQLLLKSKHKVVMCVTKPDTRQGRGMQLTMSPIKVLAGEHGIDCIQPISLKDASVASALREPQADLFVVVAYGKILTQEILDIPKVFCLNVHGSLLPNYRGAAPINWAIINGDAETGVSVQKMVLELDEGDLVSQATIGILPDMTADRLRLAMAELGAELLLNTINLIEQGKYSLTPQDPARVSYAAKMTKEMGRINWQEPAAVIYNKIRGLKPWPGTFTVFGTKTLKVLDAAVVAGNSSPGTVLSIGKEGLTIACGQDALLLKEVQPEAGKVMAGASFAAGYRVTVGGLFGA